MIQSSKILTVSYGTFSCTLEGFEDSFDTMKAIAEYFRDLAADDRYFGAEPPVPDADMLARIAEKEIARRVEAHQDTDGVHLRAAIPDAVAAPVAPPSEPDLENEVQAEIHVQPKPERQPPIDVQTADASPKAKQPKVIIAAAPVAPAPVIHDNVAEVEEPEVEDTPDVINDVMDVLDASDAEDVNASVDAEETAEDVTQDADDLYDDTYEDVADTPVDQPLDLAALTADDGLDDDAYEDDPAEDDVQSTPQPDVDLSAIAASLADAPQIDVEDEIEIDDAPTFDAPEMDAPADVDPNSIAAKLARIRQVVSTKPSPRNDGFSEDEHADVEAVETTDDDQSDDLSEVASQDSAPADTIANVLDQMRSTADDVEDDVDAPAEEVMDAVEDHVDPIEDTLEDVAPPAPVTPKRRPVKARVMKVKRAAFEDAVSAGLLEEVEDDEDDVPAAVAPSRPARPNTVRPSTLSAEDEADLQAALAEVTAELDEDDAPETPVSDSHADDDVRPKAGRNVLMRRGVGEEGSEVDRLLDKADSEMAEPTGRQRRNAISHLRAAVAATRDDEELTNSNDTEKGSEAYRSDLEDVVRPRRPVAGGEAGSERRGQSRPAPLQLVAEQRIDEAEEETLAPVRPRRVSAMEDTVDEDGDDDTMVIDGDLTFEEFAEEMGASELPDLLEAAASYMSFVEKRPGFSRPQLMTKVRQVEATDYSREDRLRSFGVLLREGKIQKTQGGQFTASDRISFRPDEDRAAG